MISNYVLWSPEQGEELKKKRDELKFSQKTVGKFTNISYRTIDCYEKGLVKYGNPEFIDILNKFYDVMLNALHTWQFA